MGGTGGGNKARHPVRRTTWTATHARPAAVNPTLLNLAYDWPVHRIGPWLATRKPAATHLLVFRDRRRGSLVEVNGPRRRSWWRARGIGYLRALAIERFAGEPR